MRNSNRRNDLTFIRRLKYVQPQIVHCVPTHMLYVRKESVSSESWLSFWFWNKVRKYSLYSYRIWCLTEYLDITQEGIFRRTGSLARQNDLKSKINNGLPLNLDGGVYTVHDCASVFKGILSDLPEPLLTDAYNVAHVQIAGLQYISKMINSFFY